MNLERVADDAAGQGETTSVIDPWEAAYLRFETPQQEIQKFKKRLVELGARQWPNEARIVELFCGRGNGLHALMELGFKNVEGIDLSPRLVAEYRGAARCVVGDCRQLPFGDCSKDRLIVQGGLHHLPTLPDSLNETLVEAHRVLAPGGQLVVVEPWNTPFLRFVHTVSRNRISRAMSDKLDAFATMVEHEIQTYNQWLSQPEVVMASLQTWFKPIISKAGWGKLMFVGERK